MEEYYDYWISVELRLILTMGSKEDLQFEYQIDTLDELEAVLQDELEQLLREEFLFHSFDLRKLDEEGAQADEFVATLRVQDSCPESQWDMVDDEPSEKVSSDLCDELWDHLATKYWVEDMLEEEGSVTFVLLSKGASGDLYDLNSKAQRLALNQLAKFLREIGFVVECHKDETTLRVYPTKRHQYPLLKPEFWSRYWVTEERSEYLMFVVLSRGDESKRGTMPCARGTLQKHLDTFTYSPAFFRPSDNTRGKPYYRHGTFFLPLYFTKAKEIDFKALGKPLRDLWRFLNALPASKSRSTKKAPRSP